MARRFYRVWRWHGASALPLPQPPLGWERASKVGAKHTSPTRRPLQRRTWARFPRGRHPRPLRPNGSDSMLRPKSFRAGIGECRGFPRRYFQELLPATFERTLVIDQLEFKQGRLELDFHRRVRRFHCSHCGQRATRLTTATTIPLASAIWKSPIAIPKGLRRNQPSPFRETFAPSPYVSIRGSTCRCC